MKIGIISDTHKDITNIDKVLPYLKQCDLIVHAGDNIEDAEYIYYATDIEVKSVKGNCDLYDIDHPYELMFFANNKKIFLCHGHNYEVKWGLSSLLKIAKENDIDIVIYGHTHIPDYKKIQNIIFINPGSLTYPRGRSRKSFGILNIDKEVSYQEIDL